MAEKLTTQQFAAKIKEKYPEYKDVDDYELTERITTKYPEYLEQVTVEKKNGITEPIQPDLGNGGNESASEAQSTTSFKPKFEGVVEEVSDTGEVEQSPVFSLPKVDVVGIKPTPISDDLKGRLKGIDPKAMEMANKIKLSKKEPTPQELQGILDSTGISEPQLQAIREYLSTDLQGNNREKKKVEFLESVGGSINNIVTSMQGILPRADIAAAGVWEGVLGKELANNFYNFTSNIDVDKVRSNAYQKLDELEQKTKPTSPLIESVKIGDVGGTAAALVDAGTAIISTMIPSIITGGTTLFTDMVGGSIADYNNQKAETKGIAVDELYKSGDAELAVPMTIGVIGGAMERIGLKGITKAINKNLTGATMKKVADLSIEFNKEGATEWVQVGLSEFNKSLAKGKNTEQAVNDAATKMVSQEGFEAYAKGVAGSAAATTAGKYAQAQYQSITGNKNKELGKLSEKAQSVIASIENPNVPDNHKKALEAVLDNVENEAKQIVEEEKQKFDALSEDDKKEVVVLAAEKSNLEGALEDENIAEDAKKLIADEIKTIDEQLKEKIESLKTEPKESLTDKTVIDEKANQEAQTNKETDKVLEEEVIAETKESAIIDETGSKAYKENMPTHVVGRAREKTLPDGTKLKGKYKVVSADEILASHNEETFSKTEGFPVNDKGNTVNDRDYQTDKAAQSEVVRIAGALDERAISQTPIVTKDGIVVDGNNRTMSRKLAAKQGTDKAYLDALKENADMYGIDAAAIDNIKNPTLIFEADEAIPYTTKEFARFNKAEKKEKSPIEKAVELSKTISDKARRVLGGIYDGAERPSDVTSNAKTMADVKSLLLDEGILQANELPRYINPETGTATKEGVAFLETLLIGSALDEGTIRMLDNEGMGTAKNRIIESAVQITQNAALGENSLQGNIQNGVKLLNKAITNNQTVLDAISQMDMFEVSEFSAEDLAIAILLDGKGFKDFLNKYNAEAGTESLFEGTMTKEKIIDNLLNQKIKNYEQVRKNLRPDAERGKGEVSKGDGDVRQEKGEQREPAKEKVIEPVKEEKPIASAIPQRIKFAFAGSQVEGTIIGKKDKGYDVIADDGTRYPVKELDVEDIRDATPLEAAKAEAAIAKRNLKDQWNKWKQSQQNVGIIFDPESQAKQDVELMKLVKQYLQKYLKVGAYSFDKFVTDLGGLGIEITDAVKDKWQKFYADTEKTTVKQAINKETGVSKPKPTEQKRIDKAYSFGVADTKEVFKEKIAQLQSDFAEYSQYKKEQEKEKIAQLQEFKKSTTDLIKAALDKDFISQRTFNSIMTKLGKAQTPTQYQKLFDYINKAAEQADYAEKLDTAKELQSKVRKKAKSDKNFADQKDISKAIARLDITELDDLDAFNKVAESYLNSMLPVGSPKYQPFNVEEALTVLSELQDKIDAGLIARAEEATGFAGLTKEEAQAIMDALNADNLDLYAQNLSDAKKKTLHDAARKQAEYAKIGLNEKIKEDAAFLNNFTDRGKAYIQTIASADLTAAETKMLIDYIRTADNIIVNNSISNAGQVAQQVNAIQNMPSLKKVAKDAKFFLLNKAQKAFESVPVMIKSIYGTSDASSKFRLYTGFDQVFTGGSKANVALDKKHKAWTDFKKANKIKDTLADVQQRGVYAYLIQNYGGNELDVNIEFEQNKAKVLQSIEAYRQSGDKDLINLADVLQGIYDADVAPFNTLNDFKTNFDAKYPTQVKAWKFFNETFEEIKDDLKTITEAYENESFEDVNNYSPISYTAIKAPIQEEIEGGMMFSERYPNKPKQTPTSIRRVKMINLPDDMAVSYNFDSNMFRKYKRAVYDINTIDGRNLFRNVYNNKGFSSVVGGSKNATALKEVYNSSEKLQAGAKAENDAAGEILRDVTQGIRNIGVSFALGGFTQYAKQYPSVAVKTMLTLGKKAPLFFQVQNVPLDIPILNEASIQERGARQGGSDLGETERNVIVNATASALNKYVKGFGDWTKTVRDLSLKSLQVGDTRVAKRSFMAHYMDYLQKKGIDVKASDLATEHNRLDDVRKEAISYAQQLIDEQQVPSNAALLSELQKHDGNAFKELFKNMLLPFNTFSGNVRGRMIEDIKFIKFGNQQQRNEAIVDLTSNIAEIVAFQAISKLMLYALVKYPINSLLGYLFDLEDDEKKQDFWEQMNKQLDYFYSQTLKDVFVGGLGGMSESLFIKGINYGAYFIDESEDAKTMSFGEWSKKNSPVYEYPDKNKWYDQIGGYGVAFREYSEYLGNAEGAVTGTYADEYGFKTYSKSATKETEGAFTVKQFKELSDDEQSFMIFVSMTNLFALAGLRDADIANMITAKKRQMLRGGEEKSTPITTPNSTNQSVTVQPVKTQSVTVQPVKVQIVE